MGHYFCTTLYILILPCILLTSLNLVLFWIPPETNAKLILGINIFVAFFLLLMLLESNLPPSAAEKPLLGIYYYFVMFLITLSTFLSAFVVTLAFHGGTRRVPHPVRVLMFDHVATWLCVPPNHSSYSQTDYIAIKRTYHHTF